MDPPGSAMRLSRHLPLFFILAFLIPAAARSQEAGQNSAVPESHFDTEHIFGFAEGSDIGEKGEREIESFTVGSFGALGSYANIGNETSINYNITDELRLSIGGLADYFSIHDVPGLNDRSTADFSGVFTEVRWNILNRLTSPFGMSLSIDPVWRRTDPASGKLNENYGAAVELLIDKELIPEKFFAALNLVYSGTFLPLNGGISRDDSFVIIAAGSYAITPDILVGAEILHENVAQNGCFNGHGLFAGPQIYVRLREGFSVTVAWLAQIPDAAAHGLDLTDFERHHVGVKLAYNF